MKKMKLVAITLLIGGMCFLLGGGYGYYLADKRIGKFALNTGVENSLYYYKKHRDIVQLIEGGNTQGAQEELENLVRGNIVAMKQCGGTNDCTPEILQQVEAVVQNEL